MRAQFQENQEGHKAADSAQLQQLLSYLLPSPQNLQLDIDATLNEAVCLANAMTEEQGWFEWRMTYSGRSFVPETMYVPEEGQGGRVYLCTFPSLSKRTGPGKKDLALLVAGSVELESVFRSVHR